MRTIVAAITLALAAGCVHSQSESICAEYRGQFCVAGQACAFNKVRGCKVCQCSPLAGGIGASAPTAAGSSDSTLHP